jgi:hypothetical protein
MFMLYNDFNVYIRIPHINLILTTLGGGTRLVHTRIYIKSSKYNYAWGRLSILWTPYELCNSLAYVCRACYAPVRYVAVLRSTRLASVATSWPIRMSTLHGVQQSICASSFHHFVPCFLGEIRKEVVEQSARSFRTIFFVSVAVFRTGN